MVITEHPIVIENTAIVGFSGLPAGFQARVDVFGHILTHETCRKAWRVPIGNSWRLDEELIAAANQHECPQASSPNSDT